MKTNLLLLFLLAAALLDAQSRKDYAVFFPVTTYSDGWTQLPNTLPECNDLAGDLRSLFGFEAEVLPNKTKQEIKNKLAELAGRKYGPQDQLLLYFSMHGYFDEAGEAGCLCPAGAKTDDPAFDTWLLHTELRTLTARIPCEHVLVVLDACYSGTFAGKKGRPSGEDYKETPDCQANIQQVLARKTRYYIASGAKQRTPAVSELVKKMRSAFGGRNSGDDGILSLKELLAAISEARPEPKDGEFAGDLGGGFVFVPKNGCGSTPNAPTRDPDQAAWNHARSQNTEVAYQFYLDTWANGQYRNEAKRAFQRIQEERVWQAALKNDSPAAFQSYLASYCPGGMHCVEAEAQAQTTVTVRTAEEFVRAIGSNRTIFLEKGSYILSDLNRRSIQNNYATFQEAYDGFELHITGVENLKIIGKGISKDDGTWLLTKPSYGNVLVFNNCKNITLQSFSAGHLGEKGQCTGGVLLFNKGENIEISDASLFGSGMEGISAYSISGLRCKNSRIWGCTYSIMTLDDCSDVFFTNCEFDDNQEFDLINVSNSGIVKFTGCLIHNNRTTSDYFGKLFSGSLDQKITLEKCSIKKNRAKNLAKKGLLILDNETQILENTFSDGMYSPK